MLNFSFVQVCDGETKIIIIPYQIAILNGEISEIVQIQALPDHGI